MSLLPLLALVACGNDASGGRVDDSAHIDIEQPIESGVAVFDVLGRLAALYPALGDDSLGREPTFRTSDDEFEELAADMGMRLGERITFDHAYDPSQPHTFVAISRFGTLRVRSLRVNALEPKNWQRMSEAAVLELDPNAPAHGSIVHANPDCFVRGAYWGTESYNDGELMLGAAPLLDARDGGKAYELWLFISDYAESCL